MIALRHVLMLAALFPGAAGAWPQEAAPGEPPYRLSFDRVVLEPRADGPRLALSVSSDLPAGAVLVVSVWTTSPHYDPRTETIVHRRAEPPAVHRVHLEPSRRGATSASTTCDVRRAGLVSIEMAFHPSRLFEAEREALEPVMGARFVPMRWETTVLLGTPASRLSAFDGQVRTVLDWTLKAEQLVRRLGRVPETPEAIAPVLGALQVLRTEIEPALPETAYSASAGYLWEVLGEAGTWGALRAAQAARGAAPPGPGGGAAGTGSPDAAGKNPGADEPKETPTPQQRLERLLAALGRVRDILHREFALETLSEFDRLAPLARSALRDDPPSDAQRAAFAAELEGTHDAIERHQNFGFSRLGDPFGRLFGESQTQRLDGALAVLGRLPAAWRNGAAAPADRRALVEELDRNLEGLSGLRSEWIRVGAPR